MIPKNCSRSFTELNHIRTEDLATAVFALSGGMEDVSAFDSVTPGRYLFSLAVPIFVAVEGLRKRSLDLSGALAGGQRNWIQVLCNSVVAAQLSLFYLLDSGPQEQPIDFNISFTSSWLGMGVLGAFACANGDTWASELATVLTEKKPVLITTGETVPRGTNGGVTLIGLFISAAGGAAIGLGYYLSELVLIDARVLLSAPPQWRMVMVGAIAGFFGSLLDSFLGAKFQFSGVHCETGAVVEEPGPKVKHICGRQVLDNHAINLLSCLFTAILTPSIAQAII
ncbi:transmembrane protein 19-like isoform X5 [Artemia franciscana]|uniref:transmembrane protein 19-like isoform X5 n=1 Tax=Artemia franciscana TaxID=6661 RepID=UPI0032DB7E7D